MTAAGTARQTLAIFAAPSRVTDLNKLAVPTLVIHGDSDPLIPVECGKDIANAIPGARIEIIEGMGHDLPVALNDRLNRLITRHAKASELMAAA
jgi:proline iminopeptidase